MSDEQSRKPERYGGFETIPIRIIVRVGQTRCRLSRLAALGPGEIVPLDHEVGQPFELRAGGVLLGRVEPVADKDGVALKLTSVPEGDDGDG